MWRWRGVLVVVVSLLLTLTGSLATVLPAVAASTTKVSAWSSSAPRVTIGSEVTDRVTVKTGSTYVARTIQVQRKASTSSTWSTVSTDTTSSAGTFTARLPVAAVGVWHFRLYVPPTSTAAAATTAYRTLTGVNPTSVSGWSTTSSSAPVGYTVTDAVVVKTGPGYVAREVEVQRKASSASTWVRVSGGTTSSTGAFTASLPVSASGTWHYRLVVASTSTARSKTTATRTITASVPEPAPVLRPGTDLRVATFNLSGANNDPKASGEHRVWAERLPRVVSQILGENPDVVGLQEAHEGTGQYTSLRNALNATGATYQITDLDKGASRGTRIMYNATTLSLVSKGAFPYSNQVAGKTTRYLVWATFRQVASGKEFFFASTHLSPDSSTVKGQEWRELIAKVRQLNTADLPVVVAGDFNTTKFSSLAAEMLPAMKSAGFGDVMNQQYRVNPPVSPRAETVVNGWINSFNDYRRDITPYSYSTSRHKVGNSLEWIFATNSLRVKQWKVVIDFDPATLMIRGIIPSDHNMVSSIIVL